MEVKAIPIMKDMSTDDRKAKRLSRCEDDDGLVFGGQPAPKLDTPYVVTVKDKKDAYHAICMMKVPLCFVFHLFKIGCFLILVADVLKYFDFLWMEGFI